MGGELTQISLQGTAPIIGGDEPIVHWILWAEVGFRSLLGEKAGDIDNLCLDEFNLVIGENPCLDDTMIVVDRPLGEGESHTQSPVKQAFPRLKQGLPWSGCPLSMIPMIASPDNSLHLSPEDYFAWEEQQLEKYELMNGRPYAMGGGSINHSRIAVSLTTLIDTHLDSSQCFTGNSDLRINIVGTDNYTYPDLSVTCDARDQTNGQYITYPCLIVEVLSASTEAYDRGGKFRLYRQNPMLIDYLLVSSTAIEIDLYHKTNAGDWLIVNYKAGDSVELKSVNLSFPIEQVYRRLNLSGDRKSG